MEMEKKYILMCALSFVGLGISVWRRLALALKSKRMEQELMRHIVDGEDSRVSFDKFPYYLNEQTKISLINAAYIHLKQAEFSKYTRNLSPASRAILISGPAEIYQQMLSKALAHFFEAKLLLIDLTDFSLKIHNKYGSSSNGFSLERFISEKILEQMPSFFGSFSASLPFRWKTSLFGSAAIDISSVPVNPALLKLTSRSFDEKLFLQALYKVLVTVSKTSPIVLYIRDVENLIFRSAKVYSLFQKMLKKLSGSVLILGSRILNPSIDYFLGVDEKLSLLFSYNIEIIPPEDENHHVNWKSELEKDMKMIQFQDNRNHIMEVLAANDLDCDDLASICLADTVVLSNYIEEIVVSAVSYHLLNNKDPLCRNGKLVISSKCLSHGLCIFQELTKEAEEKDDFVPEKRIDTEKSVPVVKKAECNPQASARAPEIPLYNEFEERIRTGFIPASQIGVRFSDIGALDEIKESLQELVMLPLRRSDLFTGRLLKPCRGILLFGPPGTGKTMLAKAIANEAGASFINVTTSTITSTWYGEDEKNVRAIFTLAAKVLPAIIFVDEVDSMLGKRCSDGEHDVTRKIKNEFMTHWDGILTKPGERILVLAATNRPFDLDEAIIRRFDRRIMVGLPSAENRELILKAILSKEKMDDGLDCKEIASMTDGYSGSDLKNLCTTAAYQPVRELIRKEREKDFERKRRGGKEEHNSAEDETIKLRPLNMEDMRQAKNQVAASIAAEGCIMTELKQWNELYGDGGSRKKQQLSYFL